MDNYSNIRCIPSLINVLNAEIDNEALCYDGRFSESLSRALSDRARRRLQMMAMIAACFPVKDSYGDAFPYPSREDLVAAYHLIKSEMGI